MLPQTQRLSKNQVSYLHRKGSRFENDWFKLKYLPNHQKKSRFAIILSNKVIKLATDRNRLRRRLYALFEKFPAKEQNYNIILQVKKTELAKKNPANLKQLLDLTLKKFI